jgi:cytochrome c oxidase assembly factor CtaG
MIATEPLVLAPALVAAALYARGYAALARRMPDRFGPWRIVSFMAGSAVMLIAASPVLDELSHALLQAHMSQHMMLMLIAPPLLWMGAPVAPILLGLPKAIRHSVALALAWRPIRGSITRLTHPIPSWTLFVIVFWGWHAPALYDLALESDVWHHVEHACFIGTALLFWRPVVLAWPARSPWPRWAMVPYLVLADMQNNVMAAIFTFSDRVIYPAYAAVAGNTGASALEDQTIAGLIMWVPGSLLFLVPVVWLVVTALMPPTRSSHSREVPLERGRDQHHAKAALPSRD